MKTTEHWNLPFRVQANETFLNLNADVFLVQIRRRLIEEFELGNDEFTIVDAINEVDPGDQLIEVTEDGEEFKAQLNLLVAIDILAAFFEEPDFCFDDNSDWDKKVDNFGNNHNTDEAMEILGRYPSYYCSIGYTVALIDAIIDSYVGMGGDFWVAGMYYRGGE